MGGETLSERPGMANVMSETPRVTREEVLYQNEGTPKTGKQVMWRPDQKNESWVKDLLRKLSRPGNAVRELCAGNCSTAKACKLLDQQ